jgi:hypothetical protein
MRENGSVKSISVIAQPKPEEGWIHRFRNFGEDVYVRLRERYDIEIAEIDAATDEFHVRGVGDQEADASIGVIAGLAREHSLDDALYVLAADDDAPHPAVVLVLDVAFGERLWEVASWNPTWVVGSERNRAAVEQMWGRREQERGPDVTIWSTEFEAVTAEDWRQMLNTIDMHHGDLASDTPMKRLSVYGATVTPAIVAALHDYEFECVKITPSGFIAMRA